MCTNVQHAYGRSHIETTGRNRPALWRIAHQGDKQQEVVSQETISLVNKEEIDLMTRICFLSHAFFVACLSGVCLAFRRDVKHVAQFLGKNWLKNRFGTVSFFVLTSFFSYIVLYFSRDASVCEIP